MTIEEQLAEAQRLLGQKEMELQDARNTVENIRAAGQQLMMAVCMDTMLRPLGEILSRRERISQSPFQLAGKFRGTTMAVTRGPGE